MDELVTLSPNVTHYDNDHNTNIKNIGIARFYGVLQ